MLPKKNRIQRDAFGSVFKQTSSVNGKYLTLRFIKPPQIPAENLKETKVSFVVSKTVAKKAVIRNKLRRWGYNIIGQNLPKFNYPAFLIFLFKKEANNLSNKELEQEIISLLEKIRIFDPVAHE